MRCDVRGCVSSVPCRPPVVRPVEFLPGTQDTLTHSIFVPTPIRPPGTAKSRLFFSARSETILLKMGWHFVLPWLSLIMMPGLISISWPTLRTPERIDPPATPPFSSSTSAPGLLTSKDRMMMSRGVDVKSRIGTGMCLTMYSVTASMLYRSWAEMGTIGALPATVPVKRGRQLALVVCETVPYPSFRLTYL